MASLSDIGCKNWSCTSQGTITTSIIWCLPYFNLTYSAQLFQSLGEILSNYNGKWFSSHQFGLRSSGKLKFGLNTHMT